MHMHVLKQWCRFSLGAGPDLCRRQSHQLSHDQGGWSDGAELLSRSHAAAKTDTAAFGRGQEGPVCGV